MINMKNHLGILYSEVIFLNYEAYKNMKLHIDLSRGKPDSNQLDISNGLMDFRGYMSEENFDCRNYGMLDGIIEAKKLFCEIFECEENEVFIGGNSSLNLLYEILAIACIKGFKESSKPLFETKRKLLCPCPGYDRHFTLGEYLGFELIPISMTEAGPDMDRVEELVNNDESIKGIFCVPMYSNPDGYIYSDDVIRRFAKLKPKASDFKIFWDNAYMLHHFKDEGVNILNLLKEAKKYGNENMVYMFFSTSKITFPGSGISAVSSSRENINWLKDNFCMFRICFDKMNQLRHVVFLKNLDNIKAIMDKHAGYIKPKFDIAFKVFGENFGNGNEMFRWTKPSGGYFMSLYLKPGYASKVYKMCSEAGLVLTPIGSAFPYKEDKLDTHIRFAPTYAKIEDIEIATNLLCDVVKNIFS